MLWLNFCDSSDISDSSDSSFSSDSSYSSESSDKKIVTKILWQKFCD